MGIQVYTCTSTSMSRARDWQKQRWIVATDIDMDSYVNFSS